MPMEKCPRHVLMCILTMYSAVGPFEPMMYPETEYHKVHGK